MRATKNLSQGEALYVSYGVGSNHFTKIAVEEKKRTATTEVTRAEPQALAAGRLRKRLAKDKQRNTRLKLGHYYDRNK